MSSYRAKQVINWVCVGVGENNLKITVLYRPPSYNIAEFFLDIGNILSKYPKKHNIIDDFNINLLDDSYQVKNYRYLLQRNNFKIINTMSEQHSTKVTDRTKTIIDHIVLLDFNNLGCIGSIDVEPNSLSDHNMMHFRIFENVKTYKPKVRCDIKVVDYKKFKLLFRQKMESSVVASFRELTDIIRTTKSYSQYTKTIKVRENNTWMDGEILEMMKQRDLFYRRKVKNAGNLEYEIKFKRLKNRVNNNIKCLKLLFS